MDGYELEYQTALRSVEESIVQTIAELEMPTVADLTLIEKSSSSLDAWDYCYAIAIGLAGVFISTNEAFAQYLDQIHKAASGNSGEYDRSFAQFCYLNSKEIRKLSETTEILHAKAIAIASRPQNPVFMLDAYDSADAMIRAADDADANIEELLDFFSEEAP